MSTDHQASTSSSRKVSKLSHQMSFENEIFDEENDIDGSFGLEELFNEETNENLSAEKQENVEGLPEQLLSILLSIKSSENDNNENDSLSSLSVNDEGDKDLPNDAAENNNDDSDTDQGPNSIKRLVVESEPGYHISPFDLNEDGLTNCQICFDVMANNTVAYCSDCQYQICFGCLSSHIEYRVMENVIEIVCPGDESCGKKFSDQLIAAFSTEHTMSILNKNKVEAEQNPDVKTCPGCHKIQRKENIVQKKKGKSSSRIECTCGTIWCFSCYSPWHHGSSCEEYQKDIVQSGNKSLRYWAKSRTKGSNNAKKCPKCSFYIERISGCDHMTCNRCKTDFCYRCGGKHYSLGWLGNHYSRYSFLGCKYNLHPNKPVLRVAKRSGVIVGGTLLMPLALTGLVLGATLVLPSVVIYNKCKKR